MNCPLCPPNLFAKTIVFEDEHCLFLQRDEPILTGSGLIITRAHREAVFDITAEEWQATHKMIQRAKT